MGLEKRKHPRVFEGMTFALQGGPIPAGKIAEGAIVDLSEGGAAFETDVAIPRGQVIAFELRIPIHVEAKIVWEKEAGEKKRYGMQFEKVEWIDREALRRYIARKLNKEI